jgi:hypothetical protein
VEEEEEELEEEVEVEVEVEEEEEAAANLEERLNFHPAAKNKRKKERSHAEMYCVLRNR